MLTEIFIDDKEGNVYRLPHGEINLKRARNGRASTLEFEYYDKKFRAKNGNVILLKIDGKKVFYGYVFKVSKNKVTCYDQLRYLKFKDSILFRNSTLSQNVETIAKKNKLPIGRITDSKYVIETQKSYDKEYLDMILKGIETTLLNTGQLFFLQDNAGKLELLNIADTKLNIKLGDGVIAEYELETDIDSDTYNTIVFGIKKNEEIKQLPVYDDKASVAKWGKLQYYEVIDGEKANKTQILNKFETLLKLKNREKTSFSIKNAIGDIRCRSGYSVFIDIPDESINGWYLIHSDTHKFSGNAHTMDLELVVNKYV